MHGNGASSGQLARVARETNRGGTVVSVGEARFGESFTVIAGPCAVESPQQITTAAHWARANGVAVLRGGTFKPRTSPYSFQGLGWEGVALLAHAAHAVGLPCITEVVAAEHVERMAASVDMLQIGARNMQNFELLRAVGRARVPVLLKRGMSATIDEWLAAAEYVLAGGNGEVVLCERGIRTFEPATRNTLDLSSVAVVRERTHLPVIVDPSHGVGVRRWIAPLCRAAKAAAADGLIVEMHPDPDRALSDRDQALSFEELGDIMQDLARIPQFGRARVR